MSEPVRIEEKVRFWEEQDRINQELIPRVIRQNELLSQHIAEHDNLQQILSNTIQKALGEQAKQYETALSAAKAELRQILSNTIQKALGEQAKQYEAALENAQKQLNETHDQITQKALGEQAKQYEANLGTAKAELGEQTQATLNKALETLRQDARRTRNRLTTIAVISAAFAITALVVVLT